MNLRVLLAELVLLCSGFCLVRAEEPAAAPAPCFQVVGYLPSYEMKSFDPAVGKQLSHLLYFSIQPTTTGELNTEEVTAEALERLQRLKETYGTRIQVAVGGWGKCAEFGSMAVDVEKRRKFVAVLLNYCHEHKLDGVDFDWEFPQGKEENVAYSALLVETKTAFEPHGLLVTVALSASQNLSTEAYKAVDRVQVMSYDHEGAEHATLEQTQEDLEKFLNNGVSKEKLYLGLPFYGVNRSRKPTAISYAQIVRQFHPSADVDSFEGYYFNGTVTIRRKTRYAIEQRIGGVMIWQIGQDTRDESSLLQAISTEIIKEPISR